MEKIFFSPSFDGRDPSIPSPLIGEGVGGGEHDGYPLTSILPRKGGGRFFGAFIF